MLKLTNFKAFEEIPKTEKRHEETINSVSYNHNFTKFITSSKDKFIKIWDA